MTRNCAKCGTMLPTESGRGRRRKFCAACSPSRPRRKPDPGLPDVVVRATTDGVLAAARAELDAAGTAGTSAGQAALRLAAAIDSGEERGTALAALVKQLGSTMRAAVPEQQPDADPIQALRDELAARREHRAG